MERVPKISRTFQLRPVYKANTAAALEENIQQDFANVHTPQQSMQTLKLIFSNKDISHGVWPPRSPDFTPLYFFLLRY
jgi:hypothetical protein